MTRCLLIACSARKRQDVDLLPAIDRYDGPWYRCLRRTLIAHPDPSLSIWVLSAEFGLIHGSTPIPDYNRSMDHARALALVPQITDALATALADQPDTLIVAGAPYVTALLACADTVPHIRTATIAPGGIGTKMAHMKQWLYARSLSGISAHR